MNKAAAPNGVLRPLVVGGDRRSIAQSNRARALLEQDPSLVAELVALSTDSDWLVTQRVVDLLEKLAHDHRDWVEPHKAVFLGPLAESDKWEIRLQIVRALPLFTWSPNQRKRAVEILRANIEYPQTFVRAWALDGLATFAKRDETLRPVVRRYVTKFERSGSKALIARARKIRERLAE